MKIDKQQCKIVTITEANLTRHPQAICYINPRHKSYGIKVDWLRQRLQEGLAIKLLYAEGEKRALGFIEYVPGENAWRAVSAKGYMFIHCIWIYSNACKNKGIGSLLISDCLKEAEEKNMNGTAVITSGGAFMAKSSLFRKNGFSVVETAEPSFELMVKQSKPSPLPHFCDWRSALKKYQGLHIVYSKQCPWVARFVMELDEFIKAKGLSITITELKTSAEAQAAPSPYATFNLILDGRLLADHYISMTRFANILNKEKLLQES